MDTNVIVYAATSGKYADPCRWVLGSIASGSADGRTSVNVVEELLFLELSGRLGPAEGLAGNALELFSPLLPVRETTIRLAIEMRAADVGANDRVHAAVCVENEIRTFVSADRGFDSVRGLKRVDPLDSRGLDRLLG